MSPPAETDTALPVPDVPAWRLCLLGRPRLEASAGTRTVPLSPKDAALLALVALGGLQVGIVDQAQGFRMIQATEQALAQADQQRRAIEDDKAAKSAKAPSL